MKNNIQKLLGMTLVSLVVLSGCSGTKAPKEEAEAVDLAALPIVVANTDEPIDGGTLEIGLVTDSPFKGLLTIELFADTFDSQLLSPVNEPIFSHDENFGITDEGIVIMDLNEDDNKVTLTIQKEVKWSDGTLLSADDLIYSYEFIGHPDYPGVRISDDLRNVIVIEEYNSGKAKNISGITKIDDKTITIEYKEVSPAHLQLGGGIYNYATPKHYLGDLDMKKIESAPEVRERPLQFGPFVVDKVVPGESVTYRPNKHYYGGKPKLEKIVISVLPDTSSVEALKSQKYDMLLSMTTDNFNIYRDIPNYDYLGRLEYSYSYLGFKLGTWDEDKNEVKTNPKAKMANKKLRQAMGFAVDNEQIGETFYHGLRTRANSLIAPVFPVFYDESQVGYPQDKEKSRKLLAEAGYKDVTGDGFVEDPEGEEFIINFASMSGAEVAQPIAEYYIQEWADVGVKVELATGRLLDFQSFYDKIEADDPGIDMYAAAWGVGSDPAPLGLYGRKAAFNFTRYSSEDNDRLLRTINSKAAFDLEFRKQAFADWQTYANEQAFAIPTLYRNGILPVHKRVTGWDWNHHTRTNWLTVAVTEAIRK